MRFFKVKLTVLLSIIVSLLFINILYSQPSKQETKEKAKVNVISTKKPLDFKIGFIDAEKVTKQSKYLQEIYKKYEKELTDQEGSIKEKQNKYQELLDNLKKQKNVLSQDETASKQKEIDDLKYQIDEMLYKIRTDFQRKNDDFDKLLDPFYEDMKAIIIEIAERQGFSLIVDKAIVLYGVKDYDVTDEVVDRLNKIYDEGKNYGKLSKEPSK